jgi:hypothetical protein
MTMLACDCLIASMSSATRQIVMCTRNYFCSLYIKRYLAVDWQTAAAAEIQKHANYAI